jgi:FtsH-binding integral membrane protein
MLIYGAVLALYLAYLGFASAFIGVLLWPAVVLHVILTTLLIWLSIRDQGTSAGN